MKPTDPPTDGQQPVSRRTFLTAGALLGVGAATGVQFLTPMERSSLQAAAASSHAAALMQQAPLNPANLTKYVDSLAIPPIIDAKTGGEFEHAMAPSSHRFHSQMPLTPTWGYAGASYLGPTFEAQRGQPITIEWTNNLARHRLADAIDHKLHGAEHVDADEPPAAVHLHGGHVAPGSDGGPTQSFGVGESYEYDYVNDQEATALWYHDHALGITRLNVYAGLAGFYLVRDSWDTGQPGNGPGLPTGEYEVPIVIQDRMFNEDGTLAYPLGMPVTVDGTTYSTVWAPEFFGDVAVVNGVAWPNMNVNQALYRFRFLNGSNARVYSLTLGAGKTMYQIGTDGGLLNARAPITKLVIAPGERADVLIDFRGFAAGAKILLTNNAPTPFPNGPRPAHKGGAPLKEIMQFTVTKVKGPRASIPKTLRQTPIQRLTNPVEVRNVSLVEILDPATGMPVKALLNNLPWHTVKVEQPRQDTVEQWNIINTTGDAHPIHLHLVQFQVLNRQRFNVAAYMADNYPNLDVTTMGKGPWPVAPADPYLSGTSTAAPANEAGWKDTVVAMPGEVTRILVPFGGSDAGLSAPYTESFIGDYVWHCHILEHEDHEMMLPYQVVP